MNGSDPGAEQNRYRYGSLCKPFILGVLNEEESQADLLDSRLSDWSLAHYDVINLIGSSVKIGGSALNYNE